MSMSIALCFSKNDCECNSQFSNIKHVCSVNVELQ